MADQTQLTLDSAVFIDIENLVGGWSDVIDTNSLSLRSILDELKLLLHPSEFAISRAYANWSTRRYDVLQTEIVNLGIEPIQVFGFAKDRTKNACDIQLTIDVMESVFTKPFITKYALVSGDGGFSAVVKRLREHGKFVAGCAYERSASRVLRNVCSKFVYIKLPERTDNHTDGSNAQTGYRPPHIRPGQRPDNAPPNIPPLVRRLVESVSPTPADDWETLSAKFREMTEGLKTPHYRRTVESGGILASNLNQAFKANAPNMDLRKLRLLTFSEFCSCALGGTDFTLTAHKNDSYICLRRHVPDDHEIKKDLVYEDLTKPTRERCLEVLARGQPMIRLPKQPEVIGECAQFIIAHPERFAGQNNHGMEKTTLIEAARQCFEDSSAAESIDEVKNIFGALTGTGVLLRTNPEATLNDSFLKLADNLTTTKDIVRQLRIKSDQKLQSFFDVSCSDILDEIIPETCAEPGSMRSQGSTGSVFSWFGL